MDNSYPFKDNDELSELIENVNKSDISTIKEVITQLLTIFNNPKSGAIDLKNVIEKDPPLSTRLLKLANSAYYGYRRKIIDIQEAIVRIGFSAAKEVAFSQKVCELFQKDVNIEGYSRTALWENSIAVALFCKLLYMREFQMSGDNIYTLGLLHNIGIIIEDQFLQNRLKEALVQSRKKKCNLHYAEKNILGFDHTDIGREIAHTWGFPDEFVIAIGNHHEPFRVDDGLKRSTLTLYISAFICQRNSLGFCDAFYEDPFFYSKCLSELKIQEEAMNLIIEDVQYELKKMEKNGWFLS